MATARLRWLAPPSPNCFSIARTLPTVRVIGDDVALVRHIAASAGVDAAASMGCGGRQHRAKIGSGCTPMRPIIGTAALAVLGCAADAQSVAQAVGRWDANALQRGHCRARRMCRNDVLATGMGESSSGQGVAAEPLLHVHVARDVAARDWQPLRPAIARHWRARFDSHSCRSRCNAMSRGSGSDVLRIDPYGWESPHCAQIVLGSCARLNLKEAMDLEAFERCCATRISSSTVTGPSACHLGLDAAQRRELNPALIDVSLDAYGWTGAWRCRRGFDSLIQMTRESPRQACAQWEATSREPAGPGYRPRNGLSDGSRGHTRTDDTIEARRGHWVGARLHARPLFSVAGGTDQRGGSASRRRFRRLGGHIERNHGDLAGFFHRYASMAHAHMVLSGACAWYVRPQWLASDERL